MSSAYMPPSGLSRELAVALAAAREAGQAALAARRRGLVIGTKDGGEVVTEADREANVIIIGAIERAFPDDTIYSEESPDPEGRTASERLWIVDPLDGTSNFVAGGDDFTVSIGLAVGGEAVLGAVYNPSHDEMYAGASTIAVALNDGGVTARRDDPLDQARVLTSTKEWARGASAAATGLNVATHASMAYKLALVASGRADAAFSLKRRKEWGLCAGVALVLASGGTVTTLDGVPLRFNNATLHPFDGLIAADPHLHVALIERLRRANRPLNGP